MGTATAIVTGVVAGIDLYESYLRRQQLATLDAQQRAELEQQAIADCKARFGLADVDLAAAVAEFRAGQGRKPPQAV